MLKRKANKIALIPMNSNRECRNSRRFHHQATIMIEDGCTGYCYDGIMYNCSGNGMYFESDYAQPPDTKIQIRVDNLPFISVPHYYFAKVVWRRQLIDSDLFYLYGIGVKYY